MKLLFPSAFPLVGNNFSAKDPRIVNGINRSTCWQESAMCLGKRSHKSSSTTCEFSKRFPCCTTLGEVGRRNFIGGGSSIEPDFASALIEVILHPGFDLLIHVSHFPAFPTEVIKAAIVINLISKLLLVMVTSMLLVQRLLLTKRLCTRTGNAGKL